MCIYIYIYNIHTPFSFTFFLLSGQQPRASRPGGSARGSANLKRGPD